MERSENPFATTSVAADGEAVARPGSPVKAVLFGFLVDFGGTMGSGLVLGLIFAAFLISAGRSSDEVMRFLSDPPEFSALWTTSTLVGLAFSLLGGYVCARVARRDELRLAAISATLTLGAGLVITRHHRHIGLLLLLVVLTYVAALGGARLGRRKNRRAKG